MKIKKEAKGLIDLSHIYNPDADSEAFYEALLNAQDEDADRAADSVVLPTPPLSDATIIILPKLPPPVCIYLIYYILP